MEYTCQICGDKYNAPPSWRKQTCRKSECKGELISRMKTKVDITDEERQKRKIENRIKYEKRKKVFTEEEVKEKKEKFRESNRRNGLANKGRKKTPEEKLKIGLANKGHKPSEEARKKQSESLVGRKKPPFTEEHKKKLSLANLGHKNSPEARLKISLFHKGRPRYNRRGPKASAWKGGITSVYKSVRESLEYSQWRTKVFMRDKFTCQECGKYASGKLEAHHKVSFIKLIKEAKELMPLFHWHTACLLYDPLWDIDNGITLCHDCHIKTDSYPKRFIKTISTGVN